eukprot:TRINITY_DN30158_c0_g1_i1.p2 TRINITY_DN30158_c0_g1~~TRINITY_DN30158_c0_g1_i1.p2  ORF type:complete len:236 (+),score=80.15 TRINITY_DN30158_c0_g1_i1:112-819(+)
MMVVTKTHIAVAGAIAVLGVIGAQQLAALCGSKRRAAKKHLRIVCISDTLGRHRDVVLPEGDVLIHAGNYTQAGGLDEAKAFNLWLAAQSKFKSIIVVEGSHEAAGPVARHQATVLSNATFLKNGAASLELMPSGASDVRATLKLYGAAHTRPDDPNASSAFAYIPDDVDVLVAHIPTGCHLVEAVHRLRPAAVVCGSVLDGHVAAEPDNGSIFVNAALCNKEKVISKKPVAIDV